MPPRVKILRAALCSLLIVRCSAQFSVDSQTVNIRRTISTQSSDKDRNMIKTCLADNVHFHVKQNLCYKDLLIKDNELPPYLPKGIYSKRKFYFNSHHRSIISRSQTVDSRGGVSVGGVDLLRPQPARPRHREVPHERQGGVPHERGHVLRQSPPGGKTPLQRFPNQTC